MVENVSKRLALNERTTYYLSDKQLCWDFKLHLLWWWKRGRTFLAGKHPKNAESSNKMRIMFLLLLNGVCSGSFYYNISSVHRIIVESSRTIVRLSKMWRLIWALYGMALPTTIDRDGVMVFDPVHKQFIAWTRFSFNCIGCCCSFSSFAFVYGSEIQASLLWSWYFNGVIPYGKWMRFYLECFIWWIKFRCNTNGWKCETENNKHREKEREREEEQNVIINLNWRNVHAFESSTFEIILIRFLNEFCTHFDIGIVLLLTKGNKLWSYGIIKSRYQGSV